MEQSDPGELGTPGSLSQVGTTLKYTFLDYLRSRRFFVLLGIALAIDILLSVFVGYYRPATLLSSSLSFYSSWWGLVTDFVIVLTGLFFGGDAISGEFQNKTGYFTVPNPVRRSSIYIGKWLSAFLASTIVLGIFALITVANNLYYFGLNFPLEFGEALLFSWIYVAAVLGFTFFFSSLFKSSSMSILVTAILLIFGFSLIQQLVASFMKIEPWFILTYGAGIITNIMTIPYPKHVEQIGAGTFSLTSYNAGIWEGIAIMLGYFVVTAILGLVLFERKEFN